MNPFIGRPARVGLASVVATAVLVVDLVVGGVASAQTASAPGDAASGVVAITVTADGALDPAAVADAHRRYAAERDAAIDDDHADHVGPRPSGGVGGTRQGVKCLHAHYAWHLAGGDDPVGAWVADQLAAAAATDASEAPEAADVDASDGRVDGSGRLPTTESEVLP